jgi:hypothetical protein
MSKQSLLELVKSINLTEDTVSKISGKSIVTVDEESQSIINDIIAGLTDKSMLPGAGQSSSDLSIIYQVAYQVILGCNAFPTDPAAAWNSIFYNVNSNVTRPNMDSDLSLVGEDRGLYTEVTLSNVEHPLTIYTANDPPSMQLDDIIGRYVREPVSAAPSTSTKPWMMYANIYSMMPTRTYMKKTTNPLSRELINTKVSFAFFLPTLKSMKSTIVKTDDYYFIRPANVQAEFTFENNEKFTTRQPGFRIDMFSYQSPLLNANLIATGATEQVPIGRWMGFFSFDAYGNAVWSGFLTSQTKLTPTTFIYDASAKNAPPNMTHVIVSQRTTVIIPCEMLLDSSVDDRTTSMGDYTLTLRNGTSNIQYYQIPSNQRGRYAFSPNKYIAFSSS